MIAPPVQPCGVSHPGAAELIRLSVPLSCYCLPMKPVRAKIEGYRRFGKPNVPIDLRGDLVAVVGPNEAGKSSLLEALQRIEDDEPIVDDDLTRNGDGTARIETEYRLERR